MLHSSGQGPDSQWFDWKPTVMSQVVRVEWELETMDAELPKDAAELLIKRGYAKPAAPPEAPPKEVQKKRRGEKDDPSPL